MCHRLVLGKNYGQKNSPQTEADCHWWSSLCIRMVKLFCFFCRMSDACIYFFKGNWVSSWLFKASYFTKAFQLSDCSSNGYTDQEWHGVAFFKLTKNDMELLSLRTGLISPHYVLVPVNRRNLYLLFLPSKQSHEVSKNVVVVCLLPWNMNLNLEDVWTCHRELGKSAKNNNFCTDKENCYWTLGDVSEYLFQGSCNSPFVSNNTNKASSWKIIF